MKPFARIYDGFDVLPLQTALHEKSHLFGEHKTRQETYAHTAMSDIWVRYNALNNLDPAKPAEFNKEHDSVWYPAYRELPQLKPILFGTMALVEGERLGGVLITKVPPGGSIKPHTDGGWHAGYYSKFYIPIQNDEGATFEWGDGIIAPKLGEVYEFRNDVPHWVENRSKRDRIAMIVCIKTEQTWLNQ